MCPRLATAQRAASTRPRGPALSWVRLAGAESCISPVEMAEKVETRLGRRVFVPAADAIVSIEGNIGTGPAGGFKAELRVSDAKGTMYGVRALPLVHDDCRKLDDIMALIIALTLHDGGGNGGGIPLPADVLAELDRLFEGEPAVLDPTSLPKSESAPEPASEPASEPAREPAREPSSKAPPLPWHLQLGVGLSLSTGLQPSVSVAPQAHLGFMLEGVGSAEVVGALGLAQTAHIRDPSGPAAGDLVLRPWSLFVELCGPELRLIEPLSTRVCGDAGLGVMEAEAMEFRQGSGDATARWFELGPALSLRLQPSRRLDFRLVVRLPIRPRPPRFEYVRLDGNTELAFEVEKVGVGVELAAGVRLF
ncbi:MAG: hypothetical protein OEZ06_29845 [Myxococcales bacterium]|nr:hypothetical protein [Myxococcales bacterium]